MKKIFKTEKNFQGDYIDYYSVSALNDYNQCSQYYKYKRIDKLDSVPFTDSTLVGNICHNALELFYEKFVIGGNKKATLLKCFDHSLPQTLVETRVFHKSDQVKDVIKDLLSYAHDSLSLHLRADKDYTGKDAIRKGDGGVAASPQKTKAWTEANEALNLDGKKNSILEAVLMINFDTLSIDLPQIVSDAYYICYNYSVPENEREVVELELPFTELDKENYRILNPVYAPGLENIFVRGYIDKIAYYEYEGKDRLAVIDYKSSKADRESKCVSHDPQLLLYAYVVKILTGLEVELVGIHNLRSNTLALGKLDLDVQADILHNLFARHTLISEQVYFKQHFPYDSYSKCLNTFNKPCPFLGTCYPSFGKA